MTLAYFKEFPCGQILKLLVEASHPKPYNFGLSRHEVTQAPPGFMGYVFFSAKHDTLFIYFVVTGFLHTRPFRSLESIVYL